MFYQIVKILARLFIHIYCRDIQINKIDYLKSRGPMLLAVNHPNSFLDAIIFCTLFDAPIYSLARGDAFTGKLVTRILTAFKMLPVYRVREGVENLEGNYKTFDDCIHLFKQGGTVLIFSEGLCENEWHLRPLKKGTARLAIAAWKQGVPLKVLPTGINYSSFRLFGKNVHINFGEPIEYPQMKNGYENEGLLLNELTAAIYNQLQTLVYEIGEDDLKQQAATFTKPVSPLKKTGIAIPAFTGLLLHSPLYLPVKKIIAKKALHSGHYDSIMVGVLMAMYPIYLALWAIIVYLVFGGWWWLVVFPLLPFTAWCFVQLKTQTDKMH